MRLQINKCNYSIFFVAVLLALSSCDKVDITFEATDAAADPNIIYYDNFAVDIATYKPDSFITSAHNVMAAGFHTDTAIGVMKAGSYLQIAVPSSNVILNENAAFDSLELLLRPSGKFYGDSALPLTIKVHQLQQNIYNASGDTYYNTSSFAYGSVPLLQKTVSLYAKANTVIGIKLPDALGQDWFDKFRTGDDAVSSSEKFTDYFKGLFITTDTVQTKTAAYFSQPADSPVLRLHYHLRNLYGEAKHVDFTFTAAKQFNNIGYRFTNPLFTSLNTTASKLLVSTESGNQSVLQTAFGSNVKISFSGLLSLKEKYPYVKIVKAILVIKPNVKSYTLPYQLPQTLYLYRTDDANLPVAGIYSGSGTDATLQTGNLSIDYVYGEGTNYSYDITSFINDKIAEGEFSQSALLLMAAQTNTEDGIQRLIINNQKNNRPIQLKLFVLGL